jgi:hypothetical protein
MPSPFPGMDPFLENPAFFPSVHSRLITFMAEALQSRLPEPYFADISERLWVETTERQIEPDVDVFRLDQPAKENPGAVAVEVRSQPIVITVPHDEKRETFVEIRTRSGEGERLVTTIEILSLSNKTPGQKGRDLYVQKQREIIDSDRIHLVEIDLLRAGTHATAVPRNRLIRKASPFDYHVCIHKFDQFVKYFVYAIQLPERLPEIAIPLLPGDGSVPLDLQAVFDRCYDSGPYPRRVHYQASRLDPPLPPNQLEWVKQLLATKGIPQEE